MVAVDDALTFILDHPVGADHSDWTNWLDSLRCLRMSGADRYIHPDGGVAPGYLANHGARVFNRRVDAVLRPHGLSLALIGPLLLLWWKGPMLQRDLVNASAVKQPAMVALLDKLETMRLIERATTATDRRAAEVRLTPEGETAAVRGREALLGGNASGLVGFTPEETSLLVGLLQRFILNLENETDISDVILSDRR